MRGKISLRCATRAPAGGRPDDRLHEGVFAFGDDRYDADVQHVLRGCFVKGRTLMALLALSACSAIH